MFLVITDNWKILKISVRPFFACEVIGICICVLIKKQSFSLDEYYIKIIYVHGTCAFLLTLLMMTGIGFETKTPMLVIEYSTI